MSCCYDIFCNILNKALKVSIFIIYNFMYNVYGICIYVYVCMCIYIYIYIYIYINPCALIVPSAANRFIMGKYILKVVPSFHHFPILGTELAFSSDC